MKSLLTSLIILKSLTLLPEVALANKPQHQDIVLPKEFQITQTHQRVQFNTRFTVNQPIEQLARGTIQLRSGMGGEIASGYVQMASYWWTDNRGKLIAKAVRAPFRSVWIYDGNGKYIGKIQKKYFTRFSGKPHYQVFDAENKRRAEVKLHDDYHGRKFVVNYQSHSELDADYNNLPLATLKWRSSHTSKAKKIMWHFHLVSSVARPLFNARYLDPKLLIFLPIYINRWEDLP